MRNKRLEAHWLFVRRWERPDPWVTGLWLLKDQQASGQLMTFRARSHVAKNGDISMHLSFTCKCSYKRENPQRSLLSTVLRKVPICPCIHWSSNELGTISEETSNWLLCFFGILGWLYAFVAYRFIYLYIYFCRYPAVMLHFRIRRSDDDIMLHLLCISLVTFLTPVKRAFISAVIWQCVRVLMDKVWFWTGSLAVVAFS